MNKFKKAFDNILLKRADLIFVSILVCALILRFIKAYFKTDLTADEALFMNIAINTLSGKIATDIHSDIYMWSKYVLSHPPVHTFLIAAGFKIVGITYKALKTVPFIIGTITVIMVYFFTKRNIGPKEGLLASVLLCLDPMYFERSIDARPEMTMILFFTASALIYLMALERDKLYLFALSGIFAGITFLTTYNGYWLVLGTLLYMAFSKRLLKQLKAIWVYLGSFLITTVPFVLWIFLDAERRSIFFYQMFVHGSIENVKYTGWAVFGRKLLNPIANLYIATFREWSFYALAFGIVVFMGIFVIKKHKYLLWLLMTSVVMTIANVSSERYLLVSIAVCYIALAYTLKECKTLNLVWIRKATIALILIAVVVYIPKDVGLAFSEPSLRLDVDYYRGVFEKETPPGSRIATDPPLVLSATEGRKIFDIGDLVWSFYRRFYSYDQIVDMLNPDYIILTERKKKWADDDKDPQGEAFWDLIKIEFRLKKIIDDKEYGKLWIYVKR